MRDTGIGDIKDINVEKRDYYPLGSGMSPAGQALECHQG